MGVTKGRDRYDELLVKSVNKLLSMRVFVGIPETNNARDEGGITNSQLGYINENGSPLQGIPARPFLAPGVASIKREIAAALKQIGTDALSDKPNKETRVRNGLTALGLKAAGAVQEYMSDSSHFEPLAPATIAARKRKGKTDVFPPLKDSGQMWRSITSVVRPVAPKGALRKREEEGF